jgi:Xaa-Pro dipeptidase
MATLIAPAHQELAQKVARVQAALHAAGIGTLAVYYGGQHNASRLDPVFWLTDLRVLGAAVVLIPVAGRPQLLLTQSWDTARARETGTHATVVASGKQTLIGDMVQALRELPQPVALSGRSVMPIAVYEELQTLLGLDPLAGDDIIPPLATTRMPSELARVERAAQIADDGFRALCELAHVGMREYELAAELDASMVAAGAEDNFGLIGAGASNVTIRPPTDRRLERGDVIIGEITPCYRGYLAQLCRTFILGEPTNDQLRVYDMLMAAEHAGLAAAVPGQPTSGIAKDINAVISKAGYAEYCVPPYMRSRGHGLGTGGVAPLDINESSTLVLERNMTMVIHPNQFVPETGYMMCGDHVVIEDGGPRLLTQTPLRLFWAERA